MFFKDDAKEEMRLKNMSYKKLAKYGVFSSIILLSLFIFYNFGNALQILDQYILPFGLVKINRSNK